MQGHGDRAEEKKHVTKGGDGGRGGVGGKALVAGPLRLPFLRWLFRILCARVMARLQTRSFLILSFL